MANQQGGAFTANTQNNPKNEQCKVVTTRSGKVIGQGIGDNLEVERQVVENEEEVDKEDNEKEEEDVHSDEEDVNNRGIAEKNKEVLVENEVEKNKKKEAGKNVPAHKLPYPKAQSKKDLERHLKRFLDIFKRLEINIPFAEALEQMSTYAKFMKEIMSKKHRYNDDETIQLDTNCSAIIQIRLPRKERDPRRVTLPVAIGTVNVGKALIDLGSSINLIPYSVVKLFGGLDMKLGRMTLQIADKSVARPMGIDEDVLVRVDKFVFSVDFVVMDIEEEDDVPLILGKAFMLATRMMIDYDGGLMKVRLDNEEINFNLHDAMKHPRDKGACFKVDAMDEVIMDTRKQLHKPTTLERVLTDALSVLSAEEEKEIEECLKELETLKEIPPKKAKMEELKDKDKVEESKVEMKVLPSHLKYMFLEEDGTKPIIISSSLSNIEEEKLIEVLKHNKEAIGWKLSDLKGISPSYCMHKIFMEDNFKPVAQPQRRLNPTMKEVVRKEVVKLLEARMIYPISDSSWVSPVQVVPKKGGMTVVKNEKNELIPTRTVTGWRMCIDYRRLNQVTRKDHFPLTFIDQMLE